MTTLDKTFKAEVDYVMQYGGRCRDCADNFGTCPMTNLPCGPDEARDAIQRILKALAYGREHGYLDALSSIPEQGAKPAAFDRERFLQDDSGLPSRVARSQPAAVGEDITVALARVRAANPNLFLRIQDEEDGGAKVTAVLDHGAVVTRTGDDWASAIVALEAALRSTP